MRKENTCLEGYFEVAPKTIIRHPLLGKRKNEIKNKESILICSEEAENLRTVKLCSCLGMRSVWKDNQKVWEIENQTE